MTRSCIDCQAPHHRRSSRCGACSELRKRATTAAWQASASGRESSRAAQRASREKRKLGIPRSCDVCGVLLVRRGTVRCGPCAKTRRQTYVKAYNARYLEENGDAVKRQQAIARSSPEAKEKRRQYDAEYNKKNQAARRAYCRAWYADRSEDPAFVEAERLRGAAWYRANTARALAKAHRRRARLRDACSPGVAPDEWAAVCEEFTVDGTVYCAYCEKPATQIDHVLAIVRGGLDSPENVVPACRSCNASKCSKLLLWQWIGKGVRSAYLEVERK